MGRPRRGDLNAIWRIGHVPVAGRPLAQGKLKGPSDEMWAILRETADRIVVTEVKETSQTASWKAPAMPGIAGTSTMLVCSMSRTRSSCLRDQSNCA